MSLAGSWFSLQTNNEKHSQRKETLAIHGLRVTILYDKMLCDIFCVICTIFLIIQGNKEFQNTLVKTIQYLIISFKKIENFDFDWLSFSKRKWSASVYFSKSESNYRPVCRGLWS